MPNEYSFPCKDCSQSFPVSVKQAGMDVNCPFCESVINLPGMRNIRALEPVETTEGTNSAADTRSETSSWLFSGGLLIGVIAGLAGLGILSYANSLAMESTLDLQLEYGRVQMDTLSAGQLWEAWDQMTQDGLPDWQETVEVRANKQSNHYSYMAYALFGISAIGLMLMACSFLSGKK